MNRFPFPFAAIVGQADMLRALRIAAVDPAIGGVLALGHRGTGKSTAVRALAGVLPPIEVVENCPFRCDPAAPAHDCPAGCGAPDPERSAVAKAVPVVDLPLGSSEDRIVGSLDLERALRSGERAFEPGLLARAHRGFLYVDEVNLLEDHLVDLLLDVAASGECVVERDGISIRYPSRFVLVGSGNPEEGDLRPQLLDRFGLSVDITTPTDPAQRVEVIRRRDQFDRDPEAFVRRWGSRQGRARNQIAAARARLEDVDVGDDVLYLAAECCARLGTDGLRGELTLVRAARAWAALNGAKKVDRTHLHALAPAALRHRLRRDPLDDADSGVRVTRVADEVLTPNV